MSPNSPKRLVRYRGTRFRLNDYALPDQVELETLSSAIHAALEYSPLMSAPPHHHDVYAHVMQQLEARFWSDIYVERPEIRDILLQLTRGQLVIISGERGTGKSTALKAVDHQLSESSPEEQAPAEPKLLICFFDANQYTADLATPDAAALTIQAEVYRVLDKALPDRRAWLSHRYAHSPAFGEFRDGVDEYGLVPSDLGEWFEASQIPEFASLVAAGRAKYAASSHTDRLRILLAFLGEATAYEPLVIIDNVDHLGNSVLDRCAEELFAIIRSSQYRVRGAMAVRPENFDTIHHVLDTGLRPSEVSLMPYKSTHAVIEKPSIDVTRSFIARRLAVLREPETLKVIEASLDPAKAARLAEATDLPNANTAETFFAVLIELLDLMVYDLFRTDETDKDLAKDNWDFARALHAWHNGSLRECGLSLTLFVSGLLQNKTHMFELRSLMLEVIESRRYPSVERRQRLRRLTRTLLYRHLLFWGAGHEPTPLQNVMVFDGREEATHPPTHFLRLRVLQYLAHKQRGRANLRTVRQDLGKLGIEESRTDDAIKELSVKRSEDDAGLIRIDHHVDVRMDDDLGPDSMVQILESGRYLVDKLYTSTEYLFWSALRLAGARGIPGLPTSVTSEDIQRDAYRARIAATFVERYLVQRFRDEHPYIDGLSKDWPAHAARARVMRYENLFGFSPGNWFLDRCCNSMLAFMRGSNEPDDDFADAREAVARIRRFSRTLDAVRGASGVR